MFISEYITTSNARRGWNLLVALAVTLDTIQNPDHIYDNGPDLLIHYWETFAPDSLNNGAVMANIGRAVQAGIGFWKGDTTTPRSALFIDVYTHSLNIHHRSYNIFKPAQEIIHDNVDAQMRKTV